MGHAHAITNGPFAPSVALNKSRRRADKLIGNPAAINPRLRLQPDFDGSRQANEH